MATTAVSIDEYLNDTSYKPDVEYIDGEIRERPVVKRAHGRLQSLLSMWFGEHEDLWNVEVAMEVRTRVSATKVRLPDVVVDWIGERPEILVDPPLLVIEILSSNDSYTETQRLAQDYLTMGIPNIWLLDPATRTARVCENQAWFEKPVSKSPAQKSTLTPHCYLQSCGATANLNPQSRAQLQSQESPA